MAFSLCLHRGKAGRKTSGSIYRREISAEVRDQFQTVVQGEAGRGLAFIEHLLCVWHI